MRSTKEAAEVLLDDRAIAGEHDLPCFRRSGRCWRMRASAQKWIARAGEGTNMLCYVYALKGATRWEA